MSPMHLPRLGRRGFLLGLGALATLGRSRLALAALPGERRLVVVILRGALDGLAAVQPYGDPALAALRGPLALPEPGAEGGLHDLGGFFGLHPQLASLHRCYLANEALLLHAIAGPWRSRSHFDAQDMLEGGANARLASGWLARALAAAPADPPQGARLGLALGQDVPLLLRGPRPVGMFAPLRPQRPAPDLYARMAELLHADPLLGPAVVEGFRGRGYALGTLGEEPARRAGFVALAAAGGRLLAAADGPRVAALELGGWDTHNFQAQRLAPVLGQLDAGLAALRGQLGEAWRETAVLVLTEFGRTVRVNGTLGTDHGTGGVAFLLGGAVAGGRVVADWPGLGEGRLLDQRDLLPTADLRAVAAALLRDHLRLPPDAIDAAFPAEHRVAPMGGLLRG
jgi:uncharacterized protein (DUF1501 family)